MSCKSCKCLKIVGLLIGGLILLVVVAILAIPLWLGPVVKTVAKSVAPQWTGTDFDVAKICINPYSGKICIADLRLANPKGTSIANAVAFESLQVEIDMSTVFSKKIIIPRIELNKPYVSYLSVNGTNNFDYISACAKAKADEGKNPEEKKAESAKPAEETVKKDTKDGVKVVIKELKIAGTHVKLSSSSLMPELPFPTITLHDIGGGDDKDGASFEEVRDSIWAELQKGMSGIGGAIGGLGKSIGSGASNLLKGAANLVTGEGELKGAAKKTGDTLTKAGETATDSVKKAGEEAKKLLKGFGIGK